MSIAQNIFNIIKENVPNFETTNIKTIKLKIGDLSGVVSDSLKFCFEVISKDTPLAKSTLNIENIPCTMNCLDCTSSFQSEYGIRFCPNCGSVNTKIISGTELQITEIELEE